MAIARAIITDPPILVLDEPTASMDHVIEEHIKKNLAALVKDKTVILTTHRTPLLSLVDRLIVIDRGKIVADGPKEMVLKALQEGQVRRTA